LKRKETDQKISEWFEQNIPDSEFNLKLPLKAKLKKIRENFRKLSKIDGLKSNCTTNPIGTLIWHNCMM
jgi:23S rRNA C2498 (ribose-2'-O)-methylase RlmM